MSEAAAAPVVAASCRSGVVGPLFYFELVRLARSGRTNLLRCAYAFAILAVLWIVHANTLGRGPPDHNNLARSGESLVWSFLLLQSAAIVVLGPAYFAGTIGEEKERGTLDLLLMSHLRNHEIVLGKLCARLVH